MTLTNVNNADDTVTCSKDAGANFACSDETQATFTASVPEEAEVSITATLTDLTAASDPLTYRCRVTVGADGDEQATDTKLIYVQKIKFVTETVSTGDYEYMNKKVAGDELQVSVYGDHAYPLKTGSGTSTCNLDATRLNYDTGKFKGTMTAGSAVTLACDLQFGDDTSTQPETLSISEEITIDPKCGVNEYFVSSSSCQPCEDNTDRPLTVSQYESCRNCPAGQHREQGDPGCTDCDSGTTSVAGGACTVCPAGYFVNSNGFCEPCQPGRYSGSAGSIECHECEAGTYAPSLGATTCVVCRNGHISSAGSTQCYPCDGTLVPNSDKTGCHSCNDGEVANPDKSECVPCPAGTVQVGNICEECEAGHFSSSAGRSAGPCEECPDKQFINIRGATACLSCKGTVNTDRTACDPCPDMQYFDADKSQCTSCPGGTYSSSGDTECTKCPPGTKLTTSANSDGISGSCEPCELNSYQDEAGQLDCKSCSREDGEYQPETGQTYCKRARPGYQLVDDEDGVTQEEACPKNTFSVGGQGECTPCDATQRQHTDGSIGATYCNVCQGNLDDGGDCAAVKCAANTIILKGIGAGTFTFAETSVGTTVSLLCNSEDTEELYIYRYCSIDSLIGEGVWTSADSSKCKSAYTKDVEQMKNNLTNVDVTNHDDVMIVVNVMSQLATNAENMAPQDLSNIAGGLGDLTEKYESDKTATINTDEAKGLADTVSSVAGAGEDKLTSVSEDDKEKMINCVTTVAKRIPEGPAITGNTIAMQKISTAEVEAEDSEITLPKPEQDTVTAPTLKMKKIAKNDADQVVAPSVTVFDKATAGAIFRKPTATVQVDSDAAALPQVNYSIDSSIVSLEFDGTKDLDLEIKISVDSSKDGEKDGVELKRVCQYYNTTEKKWLSDGCETREDTSTSTTGEKCYVCACNHNTSFAIILSESEIADTLQSTVSTVLNSINIVFLFITFMCIAPFKQFRARRLMAIQTQLCLALFIGHIAFIILGTASASDPSCVPGVIIVQYLFLAAVAWSVCASVTLYEKIVNALKSFGKQDKYYLHKCAAGCWTAPLFMILAVFITQISMGDDMPYVTAEGELNDAKTATCWVASPWKWVGFIVPVYLCLALNVVLFVMITRIILKAGKSGSSTNHAREVKAILSIATTVCLPWLISVLMTGPILMAQIFQWIFIIVTALQGPTMFICYVIFQEDVLTNLFSLIGKEPPQALLPPKSSSKASKSAASEISHIKPTSVAAVKKEEKSDIVQVSQPQQQEENIYSKVDEEAPAPKDDNISRGSSSSKHLYESTSYTQHGDKTDTIDPVPAVEQGETYENPAANDIEIAQNSYPHVPQLV